jgi:hypothetical protein
MIRYGAGGLKFLVITFFCEVANLLTLWCSANSRFLALTEFIASLQQLVRVVVLDCLTDQQMLAYDEKAESIQDLQTITSLRWIDDSTLRIGASGGDLVESVSA